MNQLSTYTSEMEFHGIHFMGNQLCEMDMGRVIVKVSRDEIKKISLHYGLQSPHPVLQILFGVPLAATSGYFLTKILFVWFLHGGVFFRIEELLAVPMVVGIWISIAALKQGYYLAVQSSNGSKRLAFQGRPDAEKLRHFIERVEDEWGVKIHGRNVCLY
jgi:hypothetical protein